MDLTSVHHVAIIGTDYQRTREFYVDKLGFAVIRDTRRPEKGDCKLDLRLNGLELEVFVKPDAPKRPSYPEACGLRHLAFRVTDVPAVVAELAEKGIDCEPIRTDDLTGEQMTFFFYPDGLPLELHG